MEPAIWNLGLEGDLGMNGSRAKDSSAEPPLSEDISEGCSASGTRTCWTSRVLLMCVYIHISTHIHIYIYIHIDR